MHTLNHTQHTHTSYVVLGGVHVYAYIHTYACITWQYCMCVWVWEYVSVSVYVWVICWFSAEEDAYLITGPETDGLNMTVYACNLMQGKHWAILAQLGYSKPMDRHRPLMVKAHYCKPQELTLCASLLTLKTRLQHFQSSSKLTGYVHSNHVSMDSNANNDRPTQSGQFFLILSRCWGL